MKESNQKKIYNDNTHVTINNNNNNLENISQVTREIYYFKNEILKEFNQIEQRLNTKISLNSIDNKKYKNEYDNQFKLMFAKIESALEKIYSYKIFKEKIDELINYKKIIEESLLLNKIKIDDIVQEIKNNFNKYDNIIKKHIIGDGLVGENCQFKTYPQMMRYILENISQFNNYKDKNNLDLKTYKNKLENLIVNFKTQIKNIMNTMTQFSSKNINDCENRMKGLISMYDERLLDLRVENNNYIKDLNNKYAQLLLEWNKIKDIKNEIYTKIDLDISNLENLFKNNINEFKNEIVKINTKYTKLTEDIGNLKQNILNARERQVNYSKKIRNMKKSFDEDDLFIEPKIKKRSSVYLNYKIGEKWKKYIEKSFNKVIQKNNSINSNESNIYNIDTNKKLLRKTLSYRKTIHNINENIIKDNRLLNIKEHFDCINEEEDEKNKNYNNLNKNDDLGENNKENEDVGNNIENLELLSNKTSSEENINERQFNETKNEKINSIDINKINNEINDKIDINNYKKNEILNLKNMKKDNNNNDNSLAIKNIKLKEQINKKIINNSNNINNNVNNSTINKKISKSILISKEIHNSEVELPKIDDIKKNITTFKEDEIILQKTKDADIFQKIKKNNAYRPEVINHLKKDDKSFFSTINQNEKINLYSFRQNCNKNINNKYYSILSERNKGKKKENIKLIKNSVSVQEIVFNPFKNVKNKLFKNKKSKNKKLWNNSFTNLNNIMILNNNSNSNKKNKNDDKSIKIKCNSAHKKKEEENSYINSKGEYSNIITIPPPYDSIHKSIFGVY